MPIASNVERTTQGRGSSAPTQADFHSPPAAGPVVCSQAVAQGPKAPRMSHLSTEAQNMSNQGQNQLRNIEAQVQNALRQIMPQIVNQIMIAVQKQQ